MNILIPFCKGYTYISLKGELWVFAYILKKIRSSQLKRINDKNQDKTQCDTSSKTNSEPIFSDLKKNLEALQSILCKSSDVVIHEFNFGHDRRASGALIYIDGMVNKDVINKNVLQPLMYNTLLLTQKNSMDFTNIDTIKKDLLSVSDLLKVSLLSDLLDHLLSGGTVLLVDGSKEALIINAKKWESRGVEEPETESVVRGPREGFTENLKVNTVLLRRKIKDPDLCIETLKIGDKTRTEVYIAYLKSVANSRLIDEIRLRLQRIRTDAILESGYIEEFIQDAPYSVFSTVADSEKPDRVAAKILEGRAAILVDGTPFVLTVPMLFIESFQSAEDYYSRPFFASVIRLIRFLAYSISILAPAIYVALTVYHQELIPTQLLISIAAGREPVSFPAVMEAALMLVVFDILREAGVRLPKPVGPAVSIVGALVLGQSAVQAGLISPIMVIVVAATAIASFAVPAQTDSGTILRYIYLALAGFAGGFGILMGLLVTILHLASLRSFGTPYLSPIAPLTVSDLKDTFIRMPRWTMLTRPRAIVRHNSNRQSPDLAPSPKKKNGSYSKKPG